MDDITNGTKKHNNLMLTPSIIPTEIKRRSAPPLTTELTDEKLEELSNFSLNGHSTQTCSRCTDEDLTLVKTISDGTRYRIRVLVTGAAGLIGTLFAEEFASKYQLRLMIQPDDNIRENATKLHKYGSVHTGCLTDLNRLKYLCHDVDVVLHLAGASNPSATFAEILPNNIVGTYNVFLAAKQSGTVKRIIYASSIHAVSGYRAGAQIRMSDPVKPGDLYGVSKCFGEALGSYVAGFEGIESVINLRIGSVSPLSAVLQGDASIVDTFISHGDTCRLLEAAIDTEDVGGYLCVAGLSKGRFNRMIDEEGWKKIGYVPEDDFLILNPAFQVLLVAEGDACVITQHSLADDRQQSGMVDLGGAETEKDVAVGGPETEN